MRFSTFLLLFFFSGSFSHQVKGQNLIADWSAEQYVTCPTGLALTQFIPTWLSLRGNPDYFNSCSPNLGPLTNPFGWQQPKSGEGIMGVVTFSSGLPNAREYPGVQLLEPLIIGESYDISYYASANLNPNASGRATNNLGILLMTENYLTFDELGTIPNFAHLNVDAMITDTTNWVHLEGTIVADSAYQYVAFGNFFDDESTEMVLINPDDLDPSNLAYYFFDDFCVVPSGGECDVVLNSFIHKKDVTMSFFPNPAARELNIIYSGQLKAVHLLRMDGQVVQHMNKVNYISNDLYQVMLSPHEAGIYIIEIETEEGIMREKIVINPLIK